MTNSIMKMDENVYRVVIPYKDIYTTVYVVKTDLGVMLIDTADSEFDVQNYIVQALKELNVGAEMLRYVFITHHHRDHSGGLRWLIEEYPDLTVISCSEELKEAFHDANVVTPCDGELFLDVLQVVTIPGHTLDCAGILDTRTKTLITGDSLQLYGIFGSDDWAAVICHAPEHFEAVEKVRCLDVENVYMAHDYHPVGYKACGRDAVENVFDLCIEPLLKLKEIICINSDLSNAEVRLEFNKMGEIPTISENVIEFMRKAIEDGRV